MIKKLIKKIILKQCEIFEISPAEVIQINLTSTVVSIAIALSIRPFFGLVELFINL